MIERLKNNPNRGIKLFLVFVTIFFLVVYLFRSAVADETIYLREALIMSKLISSGIWFGDYAVGLHGFLFKIPAALLFLVTGPSVYAASLTTLLFSISSLYLYYRLLYKFFNLRGWAMLGTFLLFASYRFYTSSASYLREIPVLFTVLFFLNVVLDRKRGWFVWVALLLMFDAKEYVYYMILPAYMIWLVLDGTISKRYKNWKNLIKDLSLKAFLAVTPGLVTTLLMFYTSIIPVNMFNASILGFIDKGFKWSADNFSIASATENLNNDAQKTISLVTVPSDGVRLEVEIKDSRSGKVLAAQAPVKIPQGIPGSKQISTVMGVVVSYIGKILYPRTFAFLSIPKVMFFPALLTAIYYFKSWKTPRDSKYLILPITFFIFTTIFLLRASHGRYLFPIAPIIILFFLLFLKDKIKDTYFAVKVIAISLIFSVGGMFFETTYVAGKIAMELFLYLNIIFLLYLNRKENRFFPVAQYAVTAFFGVCTLFVALLFSFEQGQINQYIKWGYNMECEKIAPFSGSDNIWINDIGCGQLPLFFREDLSFDPEWYWKLAEWVPKKHMLKTLGTPKTFNFPWGSEYRLKRDMRRNMVRRVIVVESTLTNEEFPNQQKLVMLRSFTWLSYKESLNLQNKTVHVFEVIQ